MVKARYWIPPCTAAVVVGVIVATMSRAHADVQWSFLQGQTPLKDDYQEFGGNPGAGFCDGGACTGDGPPIVQHTKEFVYKADYRNVLDQARQEVRQKGGVEFGGISPGTGFRSGKDWDLLVSPGKYDPSTGNTDEMAPYVRVTVMTERKQDFFDRAKHWLHDHFW
jgi:hypothetical protein